MLSPSVACRLLGGILVMGFSPTGALHAQSTTSQEPKFTSRSELVSVPIVVTDKSGAHIQNLTRDDFVVTEDGKEQKIAVFEQIRQPSGIVHHAPTLPNQFTNTLTESSTPAGLVIIVLDLINTPFEDQAYARSELLKFLADAATQHQPIALLTIGQSGFRVAHDFTTDPEVLAKALQRG